MPTEEYPYLYQYPLEDAVADGEEKLWEESFRENVCCARDIERTLRQHGSGDNIPSDCAAKVLSEYGHKRVGFVLAQTVKKFVQDHKTGSGLGEDVIEWSNRFTSVAEPKYGHYYRVSVAPELLSQFVRQAEAAYQALGLLGREQCSAGMYSGDTVGKVLVMKPDTLKEQYWTQQSQLWLATGGFGCDPKASGRAIYGVCLADGEQARWNREDFIGVLDEQYLPEWAKEKLEALRAPKQTGSPAMNGINMG